ncbi:hypothetical protein Sango_0123200 [Sesamum angolense]|uniref:FHA domain-containing protein n=1 Tax=Sesamum angolense TaxID=2727404 RepID=A0AAE1XFI9_9LAMI|nr:hypothetical protein Sango_0123200 [Sesamum angolense]
MEIVGADGSNILIKPGQTRELGRAHGLNSSDKTISRRHVSLSVPAFSDNQEIRLQFEVLGRNPIYVNNNNKVKISRRFERGEMEDGDMFCVSAKNPVWYTLRIFESGGQSVRQNDLESELAGTLESGSGLAGFEDLQQESVDISDIDPVKEFGLVVIGHEFDFYPKKMIRDIKNWDWFLEEAGKDSDIDNDVEKKGRRSGRRKRKKGAENEDEEWTGESQDDKVLISKPKKPQRPKYMTRSKDRSKPMSKSKRTAAKINREVDDEEVEDEDEDDETLGGFIVDDENLEEEEEVSDEEEEEEEELADEYEDE